jgi:hypothetical protein
MHFEIKPESSLIAGLVGYRSKSASTQEFSALLRPELDLDFFGIPSGVRKAMVIGPAIEGGDNANHDPAIALAMILSRRRKPESVIVWSESINNSSIFNWVISLDRYGKLRIAGAALTVLSEVDWVRVFRFFSDLVKVTSGFTDRLPAGDALQRFGIGGATSDAYQFARYQRSVHCEIAQDAKKLPRDQVIWDVGEINFLNAQLLELRVSGVTLRHWIEARPSYRGSLLPIEDCDSTLWRVPVTNILKVRRELGELVVCHDETTSARFKAWMHRHFG